MEAMRVAWTDERLDDLKDEVTRVRDEVARQGERIDKLTHAIIVVGGGMLAAFIAFTAAVLGLIATQL